MPRSRLRHPWRFTALAALLGSTFSLAVPRAIGRLPWLRESGLRLFFGHAPAWFLMLYFVPATVIVAWMLRRRIATATGFRALAWAAIGVCLGSPVYMGLFVLSALPQWLADNGWRGVLDIAGVLIGAVMLGSFYALLLLPVTFPLGWVIVVFLRDVSGGLTPSSEDPALVARSSA